MSSPTPSEDIPQVQLHCTPEPTGRVETLSENFNALKATVDALKQEVQALNKKIEDEKPLSSAPGPSTAPAQQPAEPALPPRTPRNLVVCIDGTSNQFSVKNTNVVELYHRLIRDENQLTFYNSGIGTYATPSWKSWKYYKQVIMNKIDLAFALNFEPIILSAYRWLSENYQRGDIIYLFGFSRGGYQIRTLAAMIASVGLLRKGNLDQIPFAYELYAGTKKIHDADHDRMCAHFKRTFSEQNVEIEFAGAWDTVSSVGIFKNKTLPGTTDGMTSVKIFRHALALHERRVKFLQENVRGGLGQNDMDVWWGQIKEVWFAGSHGDIGGGAILNLGPGQVGPSLRWMLYEAAEAGVRFTDVSQEWNNEIVVHNSLKGIWRIFEVIPFSRLSYKDAKSVTYWPHLGRSRQIQPNQLVHATALDSQEKWRARLPNGTQWSNLKRDGVVEGDPYSDARTVVAKIQMILSDPGQVLDNLDVEELRSLTRTGLGRRALRDTPDAEHTIITLMGRYSRRSSDSDVVADAALAAINVDATRTEEDYRNYARDQLVPVIALARELKKQQIAEVLEEAYGPAQMQAPLMHPYSIRCVSWMPDGERIVSGCDDGAIRIWDLKTGQIFGAPMTGHTVPVFGLAVSADGAKIASGSADNTIRVWTAETGAMVALLKGHSNGVNSVAFSPDGMRVASGSHDTTIRVWDVATAKTVVGPIQGHSFSVLSVAYSPEGSHIASGADDGVVCVWNAETGETLLRTEMSSAVNSVAYSLDGKRIVAGCDNRTVRILDAETGKTVLGPLTGHTDDVNSVAFSPDGKKIASRSDDSTVRLWDAETGSELDVLRGHRDIVRSVAFSPDGKHVASASNDETVRIWDATGEWKRW